MFKKENAKSHHSKNFLMVHLKPPNPVLQRGQTFTAVVTFNRKFDEKTDAEKLIFNSFMP